MAGDEITQYLDDNGEPIKASGVSLPKGYSLLSTKKSPVTPKKSVKELKDQAAKLKPITPPSGYILSAPSDLTSNPQNEGLYSMFGKTGAGEDVGEFKVPYSKVQSALQGGSTFYNGSGETYDKDKAAEGKPVSWYQQIVQSPKLAPVPNAKPGENLLSNVDRAAARTILATPAYAKQLWDAAQSMHRGEVSGGDDFANLINPFQLPKQLYDQYQVDAKTDKKMAADNLVGSLAGLGLVAGITHGATKAVASVPEHIQAIRDKFTPITEAVTRERTNILHRNTAGEVRQAKGQAPSVWLSPDAWKSFMGSLYPGEDAAATHGVNLPANADLHSLANDPQLAASHPAFGDVQQLLAKAHENASGGGIAISNTRPSIQSNVNVMREELNHTWQRGLSETGNFSNHLKPEAFIDLHQAIPKGMQDHLVDQGYDGTSAPEMVTEAAVKLMDGRPERFGTTPDEAVDFLDKYFKHVSDQHGTGALEELQHVRGIAADARARAIAEHSGTGGGQDNSAIPSVATGGQGQPQEGIPTGGDAEPYRDQIDTPEFRSWFGKSQVVDANGSPVKLYHGTNRAGFDSFKKDILNPNSLYGSGVYTTDDPSVASGYATESSVRGTYDAEDLRKYFTPGTFVKSYGGGLDKVLQFKETPGGIWDVQVQAVDKQGNPLPFERPRWHSTMPDVKELNEKNGGSKAVYPLFASLQKPFDVDGRFTRDEAENIFGKYNRTGWVDRAFKDEAELDRTIGGTPPEGTPTVSGQLLYEYGKQAFDDYNDQSYSRDTEFEPPRETDLPSRDAQSAQDQVNHALQEAGYDGIKHTGGKITKGNKHNVWISFDPTKIKSAIGNRGTFDPNESNILFNRESEPPKPSTGQDENDPSSTPEMRKSVTEEGIPLFNREQEKTSEFQNWFKGSKIVSSDGSPLIVYHGTSAEDNFDMFKTNPKDIGMHFGTQEQANKILIKYGKSDISGSRVMPAYLNIKNPLRMEDINMWSLPNLKAELGHMFPDNSSSISKLRSKDQVRDFIRAKGHDGIVYDNYSEGKGDSYIAFDPKQIKSAIGNSGAFDPNNPNILFNRERRVDGAERKRVEDMTPEEMKKALLTSDKTGIPNRRAFDDAEHASPSPAVGMSDADGLKALNDKFGYAAGDELLKAKAEALQAAGLDAYHEKGDEFLYRGTSPDELKEKLEKARELLRNRTIEVKLKDGTTLHFKGADFSYGTGKDLDESEDGLKQHKSEREQAGERARGELRGIVETHK